VVAMVESIKELKKICGKENKEKGLMLFYRESSFYFTKILLYTPISANQVSLLAMVVGLIASILFVFGNPWYSLVGAFFLYLWLIGDFCDGNIARYRGTVGGIGGTLDWLNIRVVPHFLFICLAIGIYNQLSDPKAFIFGFLAMIFWFISATLNGVKKEIHSMLQIDKQSKYEKIRNNFPKKFSMLFINSIHVLNKIIHNFLGNDKFVEFKNSIPKKLIIGHSYIWIFNSQRYKEIVKKRGSSSMIVYSQLRKLSKSIYIPIFITFGALGDIIAFKQLKILGINFTYILLIYFGVLYLLLWISQILSFRIQKNVRNL
jgi:phosphatidylglycerophosphate synthase